MQIQVDALVLVRVFVMPGMAAPQLVRVALRALLALIKPLPVTQLAVHVQLITQAVGALLQVVAMLVIAARMGT